MSFKPGDSSGENTDAVAMLEQFWHQATANISGYASGKQF
jgi:hypothetical protein